MSDLSLFGPDGGTCVVVGATGTLGSALTRRLVARGLPVLAVARGKEALDELAGLSPLVRPCVADISDDSSVSTIAGHLDGPVRMAVMCAGLPVRGSADTIEPAALVAGFGTKAGGVLRLLHAVRDRLLPGSRFVAVAGTLGIEPRAHEAGPGAVNAAVLNLMRQISQLYGRSGVTVHTVAPGPADTPRLRRIATAVAEERGVPFDEVWAEYLAGTSSGRLPTVEEIVWAITMLLDPEASVMHGAVLHLDAGGLHGVA